YPRDERLAMTVKDLKLPEDIPTMVRGVTTAAVGTQHHVGVMRHRRKDGGLIDLDITSHHVELAGQKHTLAIAVDVTESRRIEEQLRQSQKMDAIGQLAGGVAHDFNNLLAVIMSATSFLREDLGPTHLSAPDIAQIEAAAQRAA